MPLKGAIERSQSLVGKEFWRFNFPNATIGLCAVFLSADSPQPIATRPINARDSENGWYRVHRVENQRQTRFDANTSAKRHAARLCSDPYVVSYVRSGKELQDCGRQTAWNHQAAHPDGQCVPSLFAWKMHRRGVQGTVLSPWNCFALRLRISQLTSAPSALTHGEKSSCSVFFLLILQLSHLERS